jgi:hypothetical protein
MSGFILTRPQHDRRDRLSNLVLLRRLAAYTRRIGVAKVGMLAVATAATVTGGDDLASWLALAPPMLGTALSLLALLVTEGNPRGRLLRRYEAHLSGIEGHPQLNLPTAIECAGAVTLLIGAAWAGSDLTPAWRLAYVCTAAWYAGLVSCTIFDDNAWYNPTVRSPTWQEVERILCGIQLCVLVLVVTWWAPWGIAERVGLFIIAAMGFAVPIRAGATQLLVADLEPLVESERQRGTSLVIAQSSRELLPVLSEIRQLAAELGQAGERVHTLADAALSGISDIPDQVAHAAGQAEGQPLPVIADRLVALAEAAGRELTVSLPPDLVLDEADRSLASQAMRDLSGNSISAGADRIYVELRQIGARLRVIVADDGRPIPSGTWKSAGSSSSALEARLLARGGSLSVEDSELGKFVLASWVAT